uniref:Minor tail protein n=1 Tax=Micrococcus phage Kurnik TaxID=3092208 RepID=A0AAU6R736_9CAUD
MANFNIEDISELNTVTGAVGGDTVWVFNQLMLLVLSETSGDWITVGQGGREKVGTVSTGAGLANGAHRVITVNFPSGLFTQPPVVTATPGSARYTVSVQEVTKDKVVFVVANFSGAAESSAATAALPLHWHAIQQYDWA